MSERKLLNAVQKISNIDLEDSFGDRTTNAVPNENGIVKFECDMKKASNLKELYGFNDTWFDNLHKSEVSSLYIKKININLWTISIEVKI